MYKSCRNIASGSLIIVLITLCSFSV